VRNVAEVLGDTSFTPTVPNSRYLLGCSVAVNREFKLREALQVLGKEVVFPEYCDCVPVSRGEARVEFLLYHPDSLIPSERLDHELRHAGFTLLLDPLAIVGLCVAFPDLTRWCPIVLLQDVRPQPGSWCLSFDRRGRVWILPRGNINIHPGWWIPVLPLPVMSLEVVEK
jgi:hypothetical protein